MGTRPAAQLEAKIAALSQTRLFLVYTGELKLTVRSKIKGLALPL
jgi:hypothetical protein